MNADPQSRIPRFSWYEIALIMLIPTVFLFAVWMAFPVWDDGWLVLLVAGGGEVRGNMLDRPLVGILWQFLADHGLLWTSGYLIYWLAWTGMGLVTMCFWTTLFPDHRRYALPAALLAVAPLLCQIQPTLVTLMLTSQIGALLASVAMVMLLRHYARDRSPRTTIIVHLGALALVSFSMLLSEYGLPTVLAGSVLLAMPFRPAPTARRGRFITIALLLGTAIVSYAVFWQLAEASARSWVRPDLIDLSGGLAWKARVTLGLWGSSLWQVSLGELFQRIGNISSASNVSAVSLAAGVVLASLVTLVARRPINETEKTEKQEIHSRIATLTLVAALAVGVVPIAIMGRVAIRTFESRFWLPILPIASCFTLYLLLSLLRPKVWAVVPALCGLLAGYYTASDAVRSVSERRQAAAWGAELERYVSEDGLTVALFNKEWTGPSGVPLDYELTARLAASWPNQERERFWAFANSEQAERKGSVALSNQATQALQINRQVRGVARVGAIERLLWVCVRTDGSLGIRTSGKPGE